jgi:hypothetical protein
MAKKAGNISKPKANANYDYNQSAPRTPMGHGSFANLPKEAMYRTFSGKADSRSGVQNNPVMSVNFISEVGENEAC